MIARISQLLQILPRASANVDPVMSEGELNNFDHPLGAANFFVHFVLENWMLNFIKDFANIKQYNFCATIPEFLEQFDSRRGKSG